MNAISWYTKIVVVVGLVTNFCWTVAIICTRRPRGYWRLVALLAMADTIQCLALNAEAVKNWLKSDWNIHIDAACKIIIFVLYSGNAISCWAWFLLTLQRYQMLTDPAYRMRRH